MAYNEQRKSVALYRNEWTLVVFALEQCVEAILADAEAPNLILAANLKTILAEINNQTAILLKAQ